MSHYLYGPLLPGGAQQQSGGGTQFTLTLSAAAPTTTWLARQSNTRHNVASPELPNILRLTGTTKTVIAPSTSSSVKSAVRMITGTSPAAGTLQRVGLKFLTATQGDVGSILSTRVYLRTFTGASGIVTFLSKHRVTQVVVTQPLLGALLRSIATLQLASVASSATLTRTANKWYAAVASAVARFLRLPGAPTITGVTPGNTQAIVAFTAPADTGGSPILEYELLVEPVGAATLVLAAVSGTLGSLVRSPARVVVGLVGTLGTIVRQIMADRTATESTSASLTSSRAYLRTLSAVILTVPSRTLSLLRSILGVQPSQSALVRQTNRATTGVLPETGTVSRRSNRTLNSASPVLGTLTSIKAFLQTLTVTLVTTGSLRRAVTTARTASTPGTASLVSSPRLTRLAGQSESATVRRIAARFLAVTSPLVTVLSSIRAYLLTLVASFGALNADDMLSADTLLQESGRGLVASLSLNRGLQLAGSQPILATLRNGISRTLSVLAGSLASLVRLSRKVVTTTQNEVGTLTAFAGNIKILVTTLTSTGSVRRVLSTTRSVVQGTIASVTRRTNRQTTGTTGSTATNIRSARSTRSATQGETASLIKLARRSFASVEGEQATVTRRAIRSLLVVVSQVATVTRPGTAALALIASITEAATARREARNSRPATEPIVPTATKRSVRTISGTSPILPTLTRIRLSLVNLTVTVAQGVSIRRSQITQRITTTGIAPVLQKMLARSRTVQLASTAVRILRPAKTPTATTPETATSAKRTNATRATTTPVQPSIRRSVVRTWVTQLPVVGLVIRVSTRLRTLITAITQSPSMIRSKITSRLASVPVIGFLQRLAAPTRTAEAPSGSTVQRNVAQTFSVVVTLIGQALRGNLVPTLIPPFRVKVMEFRAKAGVIVNKFSSRVSEPKAYTDVQEPKVDAAVDESEATAKVDEAEATATVDEALTQVAE